MRDKNLEKLETQLGVKFKHHALIEEAITHRSFLNENSSWTYPHNERLEYLGDAVLELIVSEFLFKKFPDSEEGELTSIRAALVNHIMLSRVANDLQIEPFIHLSKGELKDSGRAKNAMLSNAMEAIIGAIHLDQGYETAKKFISKNILKHLDEVMEKQLFVDAKSLLQEIAQNDFKITPTYKIISENGPDHHKEFTAAAYFGPKLIAKGTGFSKQEAERSAAINALKIIKPGSREN